MDFYELISSRHSVREFTADPVPADVLQRLVAAASSAPSAENEQPWKFYVTSGESRRRLGEVVAQTTVYLSEYVEVLGPERYERAVRWFTSFGDAPVLIAIAVPDSDNEFKSINRLLSVGAAMENLLLAARDEGLGACPFTFSFWVRDEVSAVLGLPAGQSVVSIIAVGWPTAEPLPVPEKRTDTAVYLG